MYENVPTIPQFFSGKNVLVTGGTGFIGKSFIEKMLRSCPDINYIYVLIRSKNGQSLEQRISELIDSPLFDKVKVSNPDLRKKIRPIKGDISEKNIGISESDRRDIIDNVSMIFHLGASVRFDDSLKRSILVNTRSCRDLIYLAKEVKNLEIFEYVSTCYSNCGKRIVNESVYPPMGNWQESIEVAENLDEHCLNVLAQKYINYCPNTYVYTKKLAENVVEDLCLGSINAVIFRPAIVIPAFEEPLPGYIDNLNGPVGLLAGAATGVARTMYGDINCRFELVYLDSIVKSMIVAAWIKAAKNANKNEITVYNGARDYEHPVYTKQLVNHEIIWEVPFEKKIWVPALRGNYFTTCWYEFYIKTIFFQVIPAIVLDILMKLIGKKQMFLKIQGKIHAASSSLSPFTLNEWHFRNDNFKEAEKQLIKSDIKDFSYYHLYNDPKFLNPDIIKKYYLECGDFARWYIFKEPKSIRRRAYLITRCMYAADIMAHMLRRGFIFWYIFVKHSMASRIYNGIIEYMSAPMNDQPNHI